MIWTMMKARKQRILIDIDTQKHFFLSNSPICVREHQYVRANIRKVMAWAWSRHIHTISTVQICANGTFHSSSCPGGGFSTKKLHCTLCSRHIRFDAADCTDLPRDILEQYDQVILYKRCFDPFEEPRADRILTESEADEFILVGAPAEGAVKATALGLLRRGKHVIVAVDATGSLNTTAAKVALRRMRAKGARFISTQTLLSQPSLTSASPRN